MTPEQRAKRKEEYDERMALIRAGQDADRLKAQERALKALFLLKEHVNGNRVLSEPERVALAGIVVERCIDSFFFFAKHVLEMDLLTEQTHKKWADDLQSALYRGKKRMMRLKPRGCYKCLAKGTPLLPYGIDEDYNTVPVRLYNQGDFKEEGLEIITKLGRKHICTKDHLFKTFDGWYFPEVGLKVAAFGNEKFEWDEIISVEPVGIVEFSAIGSSNETYLSADGLVHHNTTLYGLANMLWLWGCVSPQIRVFYTSANSLLLQEVSDKLNQYIGTEKSETLYSLIFGITKDPVAKNTSDVFNIKGRSGKGFSLVFRTSGGSSVGIHPNICIVDDPCFVGETPVLTINGYVPIKDIKAGDQVLTRFGFKKVLRSWKTRKNADVADYNINGKILTCTANHKIITYKGKKEISLLDDDTIIKYEDSIWKSEKLAKQKSLPIWVSNTEDIPNRNINLIENILWQAGTLTEKLRFYTVRFGSLITARFQKVFTFITKMMIEMKTNYLIWNSLKGQNIIQNTQEGTCYAPSAMSKIMPTSKRFEPLQVNGTNPKKDCRRPEKFMILSQRLKKYVLCAERSFLQRISQRIGKNVVQKNVGLIATNKRKSDVYNLTVEDVHEFVANGILVANCDQNDRDSDTTRQGKARWFDGLTPLLVPFFDPKTGISLETILYIGTHWHLRDLIWHIEETNKKLPEDSKWDIESESVFTEDRQARYPEFFPLSKIMEIKANISDVFFSCQYENNPLSEGMQVFDLKKLFFTRKDQIEADKGEMLCVFDPSLGKTHSDYAAVWWLHFHNNKITIIDAIDDKVELNLIVHQIANKNMEYGCRHMIYENNGISLVEESLKSAHNRLNWRIHIEGLHHSSNKDERIMSMQPALYSGQVQFMSDYEIRYPEAMAQLIFYPVYGHDDFPDCLQMGIEHFKQARFQFIRYEELL